MSAWTRDVDANGDVTSAWVQEFDEETEVAIRSIMDAAKRDLEDYFADRYDHAVRLEVEFRVALYDMSEEEDDG